MPDEFSPTRIHILNVTVSMLAQSESTTVQVRNVAKLADVGVPTIYYHFGDRVRLIAEAQASAYLKLIEPLHEFLILAEEAIKEEDPAAFFSAVEDNFVLAWSFGQLEDGWKIPRLLIDVWSEPTTRRRFCQLMDVQIDRWIEVLEQAREMGWIKPDVSVNSLVTVGWSGSVGQGIFSGSKRLSYTPESIRDFFRDVIAV